MKVLVESLDARLNHLKPAVKKTAIKVAGFLKQKNVYLEVCLLPTRLMNKNVLSFPAPKGFPRPDIKGRWLGEIYLNPSYIKENGENLVFMLIHGFLHLLGYMHDKKSDRIKMQNKEKELLQFLRIKL